MEQLWLAFSVLSVVTGFGLLVAVVFMMRLAPTVSPPPVLPVLAAFLLMGFASVGGVYLRVLDIERSVTGYRMVNAAAWAARSRPYRSNGSMSTALLGGKSDRQIAEELYISPHTVDTHLRSIFRKCGVQSRMQLSRQVGEYGA